MRSCHWVAAEYLGRLRSAGVTAFRSPWYVVTAAMIASLLVCALPCGATNITVKNGTQYEGRVGKRASLGEHALKANPGGGEVTVKAIVYVDDDLRRTYVASQNITAVAENPPLVQERIRLNQPIAESGRKIGAVGDILAATPFDQWGRRTVTMSTAAGRLNVIQGITEITPNYARVEGLLVKNAIVWEMRMATSAIPRETLSAILMQQLDPKNPEDRLRVVRFFTQAERYQEARAELESVIRDFPEMAGLEKHVNTLRQLGANLLIREIELRRDAGQHQLASSMLRGFPADGVAGETLIKVRDMLAEYDRSTERGKQVLTLLDQHLEGLEPAELRSKVEPLVEEIKSELTIHTLDRMADYLRLSDDPQSTPSQKLSLAVSGWLLGGGAAEENLLVAASLIELRQFIREYLASQRKGERDASLEQLRSLEGSTPDRVARLLAHMKPPKANDAEPVEGVAGFYELKAPGIDEQAEFTYRLQLPPEYDPYRRYPCIVTLGGAGMSDQQMIEWWAGPYDEKLQIRMGQAARQGYIVLAPAWSKPYQNRYEYSFREHAAVLFTLRDALQRFSIDTDRVFLTGHSMGGDAAWDLALAHPDLWCGVLPIVATAGRYVSRYSENAKGLPLYFVCGEYDSNRLQENGVEYDRYFTRSGYDCTVVEYLGRGHEHYYEEIQRMFQWMNKLPKRDFFPREFNCHAMRKWDNFFWWIELNDFPPNTVVAPANWAQANEARPLKTTARVIESSNRISVSTGAGKTTVWLSPELVSFERRITVAFDGKNNNLEISPSVDVILEDARTRGDRQHPFWAKVDSQSVKRK